MAITFIQVTISGKTQVSATSIKARWIQFVNNAAAVMKIADTNVSSTHGIPLAAAGAAGCSFLAPPMGQQDLVHDLSQWYVAGTDAQVLDVVFDKVGS